MLITGAQNVEYALPTFMKARASRPIALPVARHRLRLNAQLVVIGIAVFIDTDDGAWNATREMPCVASDHQSYSGRPTECSGGLSALRARILSLGESLATRSAARCRASVGAER